MEMILLFLKVAYGRLRRTAVLIRTVGGATMWLMPDGRLMPRIAGGSPEGDPPAEVEPPVDPPVDSERTPTRADIERLNRENAQHRHAAKAAAEERDQLAAALKEREDAERTDLEKAQADAEEARKTAETANRQIREARVLAGLSDHKHGIISPAAAAKLIEGVEFDTDNQPINLEERVAALLAENEFLKATGPREDPSNPANPPKGPEPKEMTRDEAIQLADTDPNEFARKLEAGEIPASALAA